MTKEKGIVRFGVNYIII